MADTTNNTAAATPEAQTSRRNEKVGIVVSTKMQKTIVVEIEMRKAHPKYKRVMKLNKKFYAHDEQNSARVGDMVRIRPRGSSSPGPRTWPSAENSNPGPKVPASRHGTSEPTATLSTPGSSPIRRIVSR